MGYITDIRKKIGHDPVFMPCASCVFIEDNKILLQKRTDDGTWAFHGGSLDLGETFEDCLKRELKEELNIELLEYKLIDIFSGSFLRHIYPNGDETYSIDVLYLVTKYKGEITPDKDEVEEVRWFPLDNLPDNIFHSDKLMIPKILEFYHNL